MPTRSLTTKNPTKDSAVVGLFDGVVCLLLWYTRQVVCALILCSLFVNVLGLQLLDHRARVA